MPELYIITGSNGAGKSTVGGNYLPPHIQQQYPIFDGDKLYMQRQKELWAEGITAIKEAKKLALEFVRETFEGLVEDALAKNDTFVYEGHFTNDATWDIPKRFKENGYKINLLFFGLKDPQLSEMRVIDRSMEGGHYVQPQTIKDNFYGNLEKLDKYADLIDELVIVDTSEAEHIVLSTFIGGLPTSSVKCEELPEWFSKFLLELSKKICD